MATNSSDQLNSVREAISKGDNKTAQQILASILTQDNQNVEAWLLLSDVLENPEQRIESLKRVLQINPNNAIAKRRLDDLLKVSRPTINTSQSGPRSTPVPSKKKNNNLLIFTIVVSLIACGCIAIVIFAWQSGGSNNSTQVDGTEANIMCQQLVTDRLKAPSTAKFSDFTNTQVYNIQGQPNTFRAIGYVDAQNSFGAMLRSNYTCDIRYNSGEWADIRNWTLINLVIQ